jgi:peptidoglycan/xylan/chitin deacetylase (PgdA/CDA1 family)
MNSFFIKAGNRKKYKKTILVLLLSCLNICHLFAISFQSLDLADDRLLFRADFEAESALFISQLSDISMRQITAFPAKLEVVADGKTIFVRSRFGAVSIPALGGLPAPLPEFPSFAKGNVPVKGRPYEYAASADGRWILYVEPVSTAYGNMLLIDITSGVKQIISEKIELPAEDFPALWNPNSRFFVYSKGGKLYYFPILSDSQTTVGDERYRMIGDGGITSVLWGKEDVFFYFRRNTLYQVNNLNLFTRTIYGDFLSIGDIAGTLPFEFDPDFDRYWISPDFRSVLICKNGKGLFYFSLGENQDGALYVTLPHGANSFKVLWPSSGPVSVIFSLSDKTMVRQFVINGSSVRTVIPQETPAPSNAALSPDGTKAVFWGENGLELWDCVNWRLTQVLSKDTVLSCAWINNQDIVTGNGRLIERLNVTDKNAPRRLICLSGAEEYGFEEGAFPLRILAKTGTGWFITDGTNSWTQVTNFKLRNVSLASGNFRVFLETRSSGAFRNVPMVRNLLSVITMPAVSGNFVNEVAARGWNTGETPVALCFDLYDDDAGLSQVMDALRRYNIKATFFMNGDFIRRNPLAAAAVINAGHEPASLFYAPVDLSDSRFRAGPEFIAQGLARNEDDFFRATGKELTPLWHPPLFRSSAAINSAAAAAGYITVSRDVDPVDWIANDESIRLGIRQYSASEMIERIIAGEKHGAVIPIRLGLAPGGRDDYLFNRISVLLDALIRSDCKIVPVSAVVSK